MPSAALRSQPFANEAIDVESGVIRGVRVVENGRMAQFQNTAGKAVQFTITEDWVSAFMSHVGNRSLPVHWTHDYLTKKEDRLNHKVGAMKNFRVGENGNLVADLHVAPTDKKELIFWNAANDPKGMMMSAVFDYGAHDKNCIPLSADAADLVAEGAATTALLSKTQEENDMKPEDVQKLIDSAVTAALAGVPKNTEPDKDAIAAAEKEAGVEEADRKPEDEKLGAAMCSAMRIQRASKRQSANLKDEAVTAAMAQVAAKVGSGGFFLGGTGVAPTDADAFEAAVKAKMNAGCANRARAKFEIARENPDLHAKAYGNYSEVDKLARI